VIDVGKKSERLITMKQVTSAKNYNIMSAFAPQQGCKKEPQLYSGHPSTESVISMLHYNYI